MDPFETVLAHIETASAAEVTAVTPRAAEPEVDVLGPALPIPSIFLTRETYRRAWDAGPHGPRLTVRVGDVAYQLDPAED